MRSGPWERRFVSTHLLRHDCYPENEWSHYWQCRYGSGEHQSNGWRYRPFLRWLRWCWNCLIGPGFRRRLLEKANGQAVTYGSLAEVPPDHPRILPQEGLASEYLSCGIVLMPLEALHNAPSQSPPRLLYQYHQTGWIHSSQAVLLRPWWCRCITTSLLGGNIWCATIGEPPCCFRYSAASAALMVLSEPSPQERWAIALIQRLLKFWTTYFIY